MLCPSSRWREAGTETDLITTVLHRSLTAGQQERAREGEREKFIDRVLKNHQLKDFPITDFKNDLLLRYLRVSSALSRKNQGPISYRFLKKAVNVRTHNTYIHTASLLLLG